MPLAFLWRWLGWPHPQRADLDFLVYTRAACPLCDEACDVLEQWQKKYGFALRTQSVEESTSLMSEYGESVPVVTVNGKVCFRGHVNEVLLRRILDAKSV